MASPVPTHKDSSIIVHPMTEDSAPLMKARSKLQYRQQRRARRRALLEAIYLEDQAKVSSSRSLFCNKDDECTLQADRRMRPLQMVSYDSTDSELSQASAEPGRSDGSMGSCETENMSDTS
mmetsp:Transcript_27014/g.39507  ORF Transcript_27014/g.39507 Transcript_27014/m.39507 type:complete len:121 (-) Transcript_27014:209-571(-)|eukprot:CAMPEP_0194045762 /NCGR_PEP_ID=MMETSP0009_2-20130614/17966_1 /TAXON_ID=210454 /ORGANISM="Grammatophora oceanica, Strain CCMP 410" /LENGTH=120 /DNA_ID=CAMNT_0038690729 /DNA_START=49 /DNA_END=411 /DNA_ORIENTATION=+